MIGGATSPTMLETPGNANTFWVYGALNVIFIIVTIMLIPKTKNVSFKEIVRKLITGKPLREIGPQD